MTKSPYNRYNERVVNNLQLKKLSYQIIVKTRHEDGEQCKTSLMNGTKNNFIDDCILRGVTESEVLRSIIKLHYEIVTAYPNLKGKDFKDIKLFLLTNFQR
jgi:hypothetical protein